MCNPVWRPPAERNKILQRLHQKQEVEAAPDAETRDPRHSILCAGMDKDASKPRKLQFSPVAWLSCLSTHDGDMAFTVGEWQSWFCMILGLPLPCRYHDHILACIVSLFREAGYRAITRGVMYAPEMRVDALRGVTVDVSTVHDFHGSADNPSLNVTQNGTLCHQDLDLAPSQRAQAKVDQYREG